MTGKRLPAMTPEELEDLIRKAVRAEFSAVGLRVDEPEYQDQAREDFRFLRKMRGAFDGAASKIGYTILLAIAGGISWLVLQGLNVWKGS